MAKTLKEYNEELEAKSKAMQDIMTKGKQSNGSYDWGSPDENTKQVNAVRAINEELSAIGKEREEVKALEDMNKANAERLKFFEVAAPGAAAPFAGQGAGQGQQEQGYKSLGELFVAAKAYKEHIAGTRWELSSNIEGVTMKDFVAGMESSGPQFKDTLSTGAGFAPFVPRIPRVILSAQRRPVVADLIPQESTQYSAIKYMEETTFNNLSAATLEGALKPEVALAFTERTSPMEKIAAILPVTDEQLADVPQIRAMIDNRLTLMLMLTEENELLSGSGTSPHIYGFLNKPGVQNQVCGTDPVPDAIYKAITKVRWTGFADPTGVIMHPNDWMLVRLLRTGDGLYIWGDPSTAGPERFWGLPMVPTPAIPQGTALTGDFQMYSHISRRQNITIEVSNSHLDYFARNMQAIRAEERLSLEIYRSAAFSTISGLPSS